jgi:predicted RNA polymerase sigma factor
LDARLDERMNECLEETFREQWGRVLAALIGFLGDFDRAEEATQEAFAIAAQRWARDGTPTHPGAWLVTTARNRAINRFRRERTLAAYERALALVHDEVERRLLQRRLGELAVLTRDPAAARREGEPGSGRDSPSQPITRERSRARRGQPLS